MANSGLAMAMATNQLAACKLCSTVPPLPSSSIAPVRASSVKPIPCQLLRFISRASTSAGDVTAEADEDDDEVEETKEGEGDLSFEEKLAKLRRRVNSGTGVKAERRKARKAGDYMAVSSTSTKGKGKETVLLPPVPLLDPVSDGLGVELGFNSYTERINGRFAALGLAAFLLVELSTGGSFLKYHESSVIILQAYFMLAVSAIFIKYEKEKISIWPGSKS